MSKRTMRFIGLAAAALSIAVVAGCASTGNTGEDSSSPAIETSSVVPAATGNDLRQPVDEYGALVQVSYSDSGNSLGNLYTVETSYDEDDMPIVREFDSPSHDVRATIKEYRAPEGLLERIAAIADEAGMPTWGDLPMSDMIPYDASTPIVTLVYAAADPDEGHPTVLSYSAWEVFPEGGEEAFDAIRDELTACLVDANLIREYEEPDFEELEEFE